MNLHVKSITLQTEPAGVYNNLKLYNGSYSAAAHLGHDDVNERNLMELLAAMMERNNVLTTR